jgi:hypothetical protein
MPFPLRLNPRWAVLSTAIMAIIVYANSLDGDFVMDDLPTIAENPNHIGKIHPRLLLARRVV